MSRSTTECWLVIGRVGRYVYGIDAIVPAALVLKGKPGGRGGLMGKTNYTNYRNGMKQRFV